MLFAAVGSFIAGIFARTVNGAVASGDPVTTRMRQGEPPSQPLDSMLVFERGDNSTGRPITHQVLSLIHEEKGKGSYPWTLYTSLATSHETGDACVHCARLHKNGPGWSTGLHSEVYTHGRAVAIGANIEMTNDYTGPDAQQVIGLNIQAVGGPTPMQYAINIHDNNEHAKFDTGIGVNGAGNTGVDIAGKYGVGLHAHGNSIRVDEGTTIELDGTGQVKVRYKNGRIEFLNGDKCIGHLDVNGEDHAL